MQLYPKLEEEKGGKTDGALGVILEKNTNLENKYVGNI